MALHPHLVDPRDITVEESDPTYRVYFWDRTGAHCREYDVTGADVVEEVIAWSDANVRENETYVLGVRWLESWSAPGGENEVAFIRLTGDPPPGQSVGDRVG